MTLAAGQGYGSLWPVLLVVLLLGCSGEDGPQRYRVSGTVTFKGAPVPIGVIQFPPDATQGNSGPPAFADIKDGKYDVNGCKRSNPDFEESNALILARMGLRKLRGSSLPGGPGRRLSPSQTAQRTLRSANGNVSPTFTYKLTG